MARHQLLIPLRWSDFDALGHVNNVTYFEYMQDARVSLIHDFGADKSSLKEIGHLVAHNEIDYIKPISMTDISISVALWISRFGGASYDVQYEISDQAGTVCARAKSVMVTVDMATEAVVRIPDEVREAMSKYFEEPEQLGL